MPQTPKQKQRAFDQFQKAERNRETGKATLGSDVDEPYTKKILGVINSEQARGTNTMGKTPAIKKAPEAAPAKPKPAPVDPYKKRKEDQKKAAKKAIFA